MIRSLWAADFFMRTANKYRIVLALALSAASLGARADCDLRFAPPEIRAAALAQLARHAPSTPDDERLNPDADAAGDQAQAVAAQAADSASMTRDCAHDLHHCTERSK